MQDEIAKNPLNTQTDSNDSPISNSSLSQNKYLGTQKYKDQEKLMKQIQNIYNNDKFDPKKKVMMFTSEICLPEILKE